MQSPPSDPPVDDVAPTADLSAGQIAECAFGRWLPVGAITASHRIDCSTSVDLNTPHQKRLRLVPSNGIWNSGELRLLDNERNIVKEAVYIWFHGLGHRREAVIENQITGSCNIGSVTLNYFEFARDNEIALYVFIGRLSDIGSCFYRNNWGYSNATNYALI